MVATANGLYERNDFSNLTISNDKVEVETANKRNFTDNIHIHSVFKNAQDPRNNIVFRPIYNFVYKTEKYISS